MKLKALSHYNGDMDTRFGDCILLYDTTSLVVYDCGHIQHTEEIKKFLRKNNLISQIHIIISHNDSDHTDGVESLMEHLHSKGYYVTLYSSLYLKSARKVLELLDDGRRTLPATKQHILETFDNIKDIVEKAQEYGFSIENATVGTKVLSGSIVGPTEDEFAGVVAQAIEDAKTTKIDGETVMNAASVQLKYKLTNAEIVLLCGDASPTYLHRLDNYDLIQLPHHGKLDSAKEIFDTLKDSYGKSYLISDNTGSGATSGGSDKLVEYMKNERYSPALNTKNGVISIPANTYGNNSSNRTQGVKLGEMDYKF